MSTSRRDEFRKDVELMRELGVLRWGDVWIGPPVAPPMTAAKEMTAEQRRQHELDKAEERHNTLFAASSMKPRLRPAIEQKTEEDNARLERVANHRVPRENLSPEHASGTKKRTA